MYWCPFCETLNKATADDLIKAGEQGKKYKYEFRLCPDDQGKTLDDYLESKGGPPWLFRVSDLYGVDATPEAVAAALDKVLGYNFIEQFAVFETTYTVDHTWHEYIYDEDGNKVEVTTHDAPVVGTNTGGAKPCPEMLEEMGEQGGAEA